MDIGSLLKRVWPTFTDNIVVWLLTLVALFVYQIVLSALSMTPYVGFVVSLASLALNGLIMGGLALMAGKALSGVTISVTDLVVPFQERQVDYMVVGLAIMAGIILCGVGVLVTSFLFMLAPIMVADGMGYEQALKKSYETVISDPAGFLVIWIVGGLLGMVTCGVLMPIYWLLLAQTYLDRKNAAGAVDAPPAPQPPQTF